MELDDSGFISPQQREEALETKNQKEKNSKIDENKNSPFLSLTPVRDVKVCFPTRRSRRAKRRSENFTDPAHLLVRDQFFLSLLNLNLVKIAKKDRRSTSSGRIADQD